jgi:lipoprotein-anchoring transpeptidase ErfK/SrfK
VRISVVLAFLGFAALYLGGCATNSAPEAAQASVSAQSTHTREARASEPWTMPTFGIIYSRIPREAVDYPSKHPPGTIVVETSKRRLYYVLGGGKAISYGIAVGMEGYGWSGVSTVSAKREWPDWTPTPNILARFPNLPHHMDGGPDNPLGARARCISAPRFTASMGRTSLGSSVAASPRAAFACPMTT